MPLLFPSFTEVVVVSSSICVCEWVSCACTGFFFFGAKLQLSLKDCAPKFHSVRNNPLIVDKERRKKLPHSVFIFDQSDGWTEQTRPFNRVKRQDQNLRLSDYLFGVASYVLSQENIFVVLKEVFQKMSNSLFFFSLNTLFWHPCDDLSLWFLTPKSLVVFLRSHGQHEYSK